MTNQVRQIEYDARKKASPPAGLQMNPPTDRSTVRKEQQIAEEAAEINAVRLGMNESHEGRVHRDECMA